MSAEITHASAGDAYCGEVLEVCPARSYDFMDCSAVVVSGSRFNPCGHMLLNAGGCAGWYFHITEVHGYPRYMGAQGFRRFLRENDKREVVRIGVPLPDPARAMRKLEELLEQKWTWFVLPHNCVHFVEEVLQAGGGKERLWSNCPALQGLR
jgi:hypothetical protein